jgi:hypothetical protein
MYYQSPIQIQQNPAKSGQAGPKKIKEKGPDFLESALPNRAFSIGCADPPEQKNLLPRFPSP